MFCGFPTTNLICVTTDCDGRVLNCVLSGELYKIERYFFHLFLKIRLKTIFENETDSLNRT